MARLIEAQLPDGQRIELQVPDGATNEQIKAKLQQLAPPQQPTPPPSPLAQKVGQQLPGVVDPTATTGQGLLQAATTPIRGLRGLAVGAERLTRGTGIIGRSIIPGALTTTPSETFAKVAQQAPQALERAAEAVQPGFEPEDLREQVTSIAAETAAIGLFTAPLGGIGGAGKLAQGLKALPSVVRTGMLGGSAAAITNAVDKGEIDAVDVGIGTIIGGAALPLIGLASVATGRFIRSVTRLLGSGVLKQIQPSSVRAIEQAPMSRITKFFAEDPVKATRNTILNVQVKSAQAHAKVTNRLNQVRSKIGLSNQIDADILSAAPDFTPENPDQLIQKFGVLTDPSVRRNLDPNTHLKGLIKLKQDLGAFVKFNEKLSAGGQSIKLNKQAKRLFGDERIFVNTVKKIDNTIKSIPGGQEQLRMNKLWSASKKIHENVTKKILDDQKGPQFLRRTLLGDNLAELSLPKSDLAALKKLERRSGIKFIQDLKTDLSLLDADDAAVRGNILGLLATTAGPRNTALVLRGGEIVSNIARSLSQLLNSPITAAQISSVLTQGRQSP